MVFRIDGLRDRPPLSWSDGCGQKCFEQQNSLSINNEQGDPQSTYLSQKNRSSTKIHQRLSNMSSTDDNEDEICKEVSRDTKNSLQE